MNKNTLKIYTLGKPGEKLPTKKEFDKLVKKLKNSSKKDNVSS